MNQANPTGSGLSGKVALITGGGGGIGSATARRLAQSGAAVAVADYDRDRADAVARELADAGARALAVQVDVAEEGSVAETVRTVERSLGPVDILVNAAGVQGINAPVWETDFAEWRRVLAIDLDSVFLCSKAVIPGMIERRYGRIISVASNRGKDVSPGLAHYCTAKAGVIALTKTLAKELVQYNILVHSVAPGPIDTNMVRDPNAGSIEEMKRIVPLGRLGRADEVADLIEYLASDRVTYSTGFCWDVSGGRAVY